MFSGIKESFDQFEKMVQETLPSLKEIELPPKATLASFFHIAKAILVSKNTSVKRLNLSAFLGEKEQPIAQVEAFKTLDNLLRQNNAIVELILDSNKISDEVADIFAKTLQGSLLQSIHMNFCDFESMGGLRKVIAAACQNKVIINLCLVGSVSFPAQEIQTVLKPFYDENSEKLKLDAMTLECFTKRISEQKPEKKSEGALVSREKMSPEKSLVNLESQFATLQVEFENLPFSPRRDSGLQARLQQRAQKVRSLPTPVRGLEKKVMLPLQVENDNTGRTLFPKLEAAKSQKQTENTTFFAKNKYQLQVEEELKKLDSISRRRTGPTPSRGRMVLPGIKR